MKQEQLYSKACLWEIIDIICTKYLALEGLQDMIVDDITQHQIVRGLVILMAFDCLKEIWYYYIYISIYINLTEKISDFIYRCHWERQWQFKITQILSWNLYFPEFGIIIENVLCLSWSYYDSKAIPSRKAILVWVILF